MDSLTSIGKALLSIYRRFHHQPRLVFAVVFCFIYLGFAFITVRQHLTGRVFESLPQEFLSLVPICLFFAVVIFFWLKFVFWSWLRARGVSELRMKGGD